MRHNQSFAKNLGRHFSKLSDSTLQKLEKSIYSAYTRHYAFKTMGCDQVSREKQREDIKNLLASLEEASSRLFLLDLPPLLEIPAREQYRPYRDEIGKPSFDDEVNELFGRIQHLLKLFESIQFPPLRTNPGKKDRDTFLKQVRKAYAEHVAPFYSSKEMEETFTIVIFEHFKIPLPEHMNKMLKRVATTDEATGITVEWPDGDGL